MFERGHVFRLFSRLPAHFASQSDAPVGAPRQFRSTEHLSTEAIAAYVDGELRMNAHMRAATHLSQCVECVAEVDAQRQAREALRDSYPIDPPTSLVGRLTQIRDELLERDLDLHVVGFDQRDLFVQLQPNDPGLLSQ